jgi:hypothetical protein
MSAWYHADLPRAACPLTISLLLSACGPGKTPISVPGDTPAVPDASSGPARSEPPKTAQLWTRLAEVRGWGPVNDKPFVSEGHPPGHYLANVHVSPEAREAYLGLMPGGELPVGTVLAELQHDPRRDQPGPIFAMLKMAPGRWEFLAAEPDGRIRERGQLALCVRCHAEAVADHLFGLPSADEPE